MDPNLNNSIPLAFEGFQYPYYNLSPRQFESLIYDIALQEIKHKKCELGEAFDSAGWLDKPGDRGRDILLFKQGKTQGVIQCKHSHSNTKKFTKNECLKEIVKFVLNYLIDSSLIYDINDFKYYFSVSSNFEEEALLFLSDFRNRILSEKRLETIITGVTGEYRKIKKQFNGDYRAVKDILASLRVDRIDSSLIDNWLNQTYNQNIVVQYFKLKVVRSEDTAIKTSNIPPQDIIDNFKSSSHALSDYENFFYGINDSHIERNETSVLHQWIRASLKPEEQSLAVLIGKPGCGKSVVLKDLFDILCEEDIPVLGIKADRYYSNNIEELDKSLGLPDSIIRLLNTVSRSQEKVVVIIDQLDALSQTLSAKREYLNTFYLLIHKLLDIDNVRIIVSVRKFDLDTESEFAFLKKYKKITLGELSKHEVLNVTRNLAPIPKLNNEIHQLLQIPYNLNAFVKIYSRKLNLNELKSTADLYKELWLQKINAKPKEIGISEEDSKSLLYEIAKQMQQWQMIKVPLSGFREKYLREIDYLSKEGILKITDFEIQFFHQTFYDFVYAKQFCESNESVLKYVNSRWQSIGIRSMVKMVFSFHRETNQEEYLKNLSVFLSKKSVRFHLKLLILQLLASEQRPTIGEIEFVKRRILKSKRFRQIFIESINSVEWLDFVIKEGIINDLENPLENWSDKIIKKFNISYLSQLLPRINYDSYPVRRKKSQYMWRYLFRKMLPEGRTKILEYLEQNEIEDKNTFVLNILYFLKIWDNPKAFHLYEKFKTPITEDMHSSYKILEDAMNIDVDWVIAHFRESLLERIEKHKNDILRIEWKFSHSDQDLFNKLYKVFPEKAFKLNLELVLFLVEKTQYPNILDENGLISDHAFAHTEFGDNHDYRYLFTKLGKEIQSFASNSSPVFDEFIKEHFYSKYKSINKLVVYGLLANPSTYVDNIFVFFQRYYAEKLLNDSPSWHYYLRKLLGAAYTYFSKEQKNEINKIVLSVHYPKEYRISSNENGKKKLYTFFGHLLFKYLRCIPFPEIEKQKELLRKFQECSRRYKDEPEEKPHRSGVYSIGPPLNSQAYEKMRLNQWKASFIRYNDDTQRDFFGHKGGLLEHARAFEAEVKKRPEYFADFIYEVIENKEVDIAYVVYGLRALFEVKFDFDTFIRIYSKLLSYREINDENTTYLIWMVDYLLNKEYMDDIVFNFLIHASRYGETPNQVLNPTHLVSDGINSTRGAAIEKLIQITYNPDYSEKIFKAVELACEDKFDCVRATILYHLAYLNHYDIYRSFRLFKQLVNTENVELLKASFWSARYYRSNFFEELIPIFRKFISVDVLIEDTTDFIGVSWLEGVKGSEKLLNEIIKKSEAVRVRMVHIMSVNFFHEDNTVQAKCIQLFYRFLNEDSKEFADSYSHIFINLPIERFTSLLPVLVKYSKAKICWKNPHYFVEFLFKCSAKYPIESLKLLSNVNPSYYNEDSEYIFYSNDFLDVIVGSYNSLVSQRQKNSRQIKHSLDLFDKYLQDQRFRNAAEEILMKNDY